MALPAAGLPPPTHPTGGTIESVLDPSIALLHPAQHGQLSPSITSGELLLFSQGQGDLTLLQLQPAAAAATAGEDLGSSSTGRYVMAAVRAAEAQHRQHRLTAITSGDTAAAAAAAMEGMEGRRRAVATAAAVAMAAVVVVVTVPRISRGVVSSCFNSIAVWVRLWFNSIAGLGFRVSRRTAWAPTSIHVWYY